MKKNSTNNEKTNIFEKIKAFFLRRKNGEKEVSDEVVVHQDLKDTSKTSLESRATDFSFEVQKEDAENSFDNPSSFEETQTDDLGGNDEGQSAVLIDDGNAKESDSQETSLSNINLTSEENTEAQLSRDNVDLTATEKKDGEPMLHDDLSDVKLTAQQEYVANKNINVAVPETLVRSFTAKLMGIDTELQEYYSHLKNYALSFSGTRYRTSWQYDSIYKTKVLIARFVIKGKSLWMYCSLSPEEIPTGTNFVETKDKKYEGLQTGLKIQGARTFKQAKTLLLIASEKEGLTFSEREEENFIPSLMSDEELIEQGLIRKVISSTNPK